MRYGGSIYMIDWLGWIAAGVLIMTIGRQVYTQWKTRSVQGVSRWLFVGQITASIGFVLYSYALKNWVFVITNLVIFITAVFGQVVFTRNQIKNEPGARAGPESR